DLAQAAKWYRLAAEQGHLDAQNNLGFMYAQGRGVPQDRVQAYAWLNMAAEGGNETAKMNRVLIKDEMTPDEREDGNKLASEFAEKYPKK
ncbi:MAG: tetratricopeptide repeat protein, partial [Gammaproteobacteria bacterium]